MPANTPVLALPYPVPADTVDVPRDVQALATKLDTFTSLQPPRVSALPGSPVDGQECYYVADATNAVIWHLRYNAGSASAYKWEVIGGSRMWAEVNTSEVVSSAGYADLTTVGPQLTAPLAGDYLIAYGAALIPAAASAAVVVAAPAIGATAPIGNDNLAVQNPSSTASVVASVAREVRKNAVAAAAVIKLQYSQAGGNGNASRRTLSIVPVRVG